MSVTCFQHLSHRLTVTAKNTVIDAEKTLKKGNQEAGLKSKRFLKKPNGFLKNPKKPRKRKRQRKRRKKRILIFPLYPPLPGGQRKNFLLLPLNKSGITAFP